MIHIIGDIVQSIGVIIAAIIIYFFPKFHIIDPIMTIIFSVIVMITTIPIIKQCIYVIMQGTPLSIDIIQVKKVIEEVLLINLDKLCRLCNMHSCLLFVTR
jgi:zinc transporter 2